MNEASLSPHPRWISSRLTGRSSRALRILVVFAVGTATLAVFGGSSPVAATNASETADVSSAVRYDTSRGGRQVYGSIPDDLWDEDDDAVNLPMPFPINFFGARYTNACVSTNGVIFPANPGDSCADDYDYGVGDLALDEEAPAMAVLELDLDPGDSLELADGRDIDDLYGSATGTLASGVLTFSATSHELKAGDYVAFVATNTLLDAGGSYPVTVVDPDTFSIPLPGVVDLDPVTGGDQTSVSAGDWAYSNGVGTRAVYVGQTTVNGADAFVVTWYRIPHNDGDNPDDRSSTLQLVLIKASSGAADTGWDYTVEYNIGTMTDDEDGYKFDDPSDDCEAWTSYPAGDQRDTCRWGMGFGSFVDDIALSSISVSGGFASLVTAAPHGIDDTGIGVRLELPGDSRLGSISGDTTWGEVVNPTTIKVQTTDGDAAPTDISDLEMSASDVYELFSTTSIADLVDSGGVKALVRNSLNSTVLGRYRFGMVAGSVTAFKPPSMDGTPNVVPGLPDAPAVEPVRDSGGNLPQLARGRSRVLEGSQAVNVRVSIRKKTTLVLRGSNFNLQLRARCTVACTIRTAPNGRSMLVLQKDGTASVSGSGYEPGSSVYAWMFSTPTLLGEITVGPDGSFRGQVPLTGIPTGTHTLQVNGTSSTGTVRSANLGVVVSRTPNTVGRPPTAVLPSTGGGISEWAWVLGSRFARALRTLDRQYRGR